MSDEREALVRALDEADKRWDELSEEISELQSQINDVEDEYRKAERALAQHDAAARADGGGR